MGLVKVGVAGWAYKDWEGIVYPKRQKAAPHPLEILAQFVDVVEINTSFYGHVAPSQAKLWCEKAAGTNRDFVFTAKLNRCFTHAPMAAVQPTSAETLQPNPADEKLAKAGLDALAQENRLGALLAQFPISFKNTGANRDYLHRLMERFGQYPLAVEVRHATWNSEAVLAEFAAARVAFCNIDQPLLGRAIKPTAHATSAIGYVRLHGRNYDQWFEHEKAHERYNYLYTEPQLEKWKDKIETIAGKTEMTFVIANNHFEGKAAVNVVQLRRMLGQKNLTVPETLVARYPVLEKAMHHRDTEAKRMIERLDG